jgi:hypothetical protein
MINKAKTLEKNWKEFKDYVKIFQQKCISIYLIVRKN